MSDNPGRYNSEMLQSSIVGPAERHRLTRPPVPPAHRFMPRDVDIVAIVARYRFVNTPQIAEALGASVPVIARRAYALWAHGYLHRPEQQAAYRASHFYNGDTPRIYELTRKGARLLEERGIDLKHRLDSSFRSGSAVNLPHTLETASFMIRTSRAVEAAGLVLRDHHDCIAHFPEATRKSRRPFSIHVQVPLTTTGRNGPRTETVRLTNIPDRLFEIHLPDQTRLNFLLEIDRGNQSHNAKRMITKSNTRRKQMVYYHAYKADRYRDLFGWARQRVLFVVPSDTRIDNMIDHQRAITGEHATSMFLYATPEKLSEHGVLGPAWRSSSGARISILPPTTETV